MMYLYLVNNDKNPETAPGGWRNPKGSFGTDDVGGNIN